MIRKDKQGFTIIELLTAFSLATVVMVFLFNILVSVKKNYIQNTVESELYAQQALLSRALSQDAREWTLVRITGGATSSGNYSYTFSFLDDDNNTITKTLTITETQVKYGDYQYDVLEKASSTIQLTASGSKSGVSMITRASSKTPYAILNIPIYSDVMGSENYGVKIIYMYTPQTVVSVTS